MLSSEKLKTVRRDRGMSVDALADHIARSGLEKKEARSAIKNWEKALFKPAPRADDIEKLGAALSVEVTDLSDWRSSCRYAPFSARKPRLVRQ